MERRQGRGPGHLHLGIPLFDTSVGRRRLCSFPTSPSLIAIQLCQGANRVLRVLVWFHSFIPSTYKTSLSNVPKPTVRGKCFMKAQQFSAFTEAAILSESRPLQHRGLSSGRPFIPSTPHPPVPLSLSWLLILCRLQNSPQRIVVGE